MSEPVRNFSCKLKSQPLLTEKMFFQTLFFAVFHDLRCKTEFSQSICLFSHGLFLEDTENANILCTLKVSFYLSQLQISGNVLYSLLFCFHSPTVVLLQASIPVRYIVSKCYGEDKSNQVSLCAAKY